VLKKVEKQRDEVEAAAARAREKVRKYQQERLVAIAKEKGRNLGFDLMPPFDKDHASRAAFIRGVSVVSYGVNNRLTLLPEAGRTVPGRGLLLRLGRRRPTCPERTPHC